MNTEVGIIISNYLKKILIVDAPSYEVVIVGSVARRENKIKDIDLLVITPTYRTNVINKAFFDSPRVQLIKRKECGERRCSMIVMVDNQRIKVDIFYAIKANKPFALLHHIGPKSYLLRLRRLAKLKGYLLNQYGIFHRDSMKRVQKRFNNVCDIQKFLDVTCRPPKQRR